LIDGIKDVNSDANVLVYPNPSDGNFIVEFLNGQIARELKLEIRNTLGQVVFYSEEKILASQQTKTIDLKALPSGIYFIELRTKNTSIKKKLIILK
jgi:hypothetical protein